MFVCTGVGVLNGQLYAAGGHDGPLVRKSVEVYDPATNNWRQVCDMNMCRRNAGEQPEERQQCSTLSSVMCLSFRYINWSFTCAGKKRNCVNYSEAIFA